jgi:hypothetical protein
MVSSRPLSETRTRDDAYSTRIQIHDYKNTNLFNNQSAHHTQYFPEVGRRKKRLVAGLKTLLYQSPSGEGGPKFKMILHE